MALTKESEVKTPIKRMYGLSAGSTIYPPNR